MLSSGVYAVTGGLGGLGVRAAALVDERGTCGVLLASRSGRVARDGQNLETQLQSLSAVVAVEACDSADARDASTLLSGRLRPWQRRASQLRDSQCVPGRARLVATVVWQGGMQYAVAARGRCGHGRGRLCCNP